jgi:hypothetical protein
MMRHIKEYNEFYDAEDLQDLVDTLADVGQMSKFKVECNVFVMVPDKGKHSYDWPEWAFRNIETEVVCTDSEAVAQEKAFEKVLAGDFKVESNSYLDQMFESAPELVPVLSKENTIRIAKEVEKLPADHPDRDVNGSLYTLQFILVHEIEGLMTDRISNLSSGELRHLNENIGYNVRITKI